MQSPTDRIIRDLHAALSEAYADAGQGEILDHLAWEVGSAANELVRPARWVGEGLVASGIAANRSEAQARVARIVADHVGNLDVLMLASAEPLPDHLPAAAADWEDALGEWRRRAAVRAMEDELPMLSLPVHARLESCDRRELDQAAATMLALARAHGDPDVLDDVIVSLLVFGSDWGGRGWEGAPEPDPTGPVPFVLA